MSVDQAKYNFALEDNLKHVIDGKKDAAQAFFRSFLEGPLFIPERFQTHPMSDAPNYPDQFLNILGIQDKQNVFVPIFSRPEKISDWSGCALKYRIISGAQLVEILPEGWWLTLNPASEIGKEFSPWEIEKLKGGLAEIPEIIEENFAFQAPDPINLTVPNESEYNTLISELKIAATNNGAVQRMFLLREECEELAGKTTRTLLLGIETNIKDQSHLETLQNQFQLIAERALIGAEPIKLIIETKRRNNVAFKIFSTLSPFYEVKPRNMILHWISKIVFMQ